MIDGWRIVSEWECRFKEKILRYDGVVLLNADEIVSEEEKRVGHKKYLGQQVRRVPSSKMMSPFPVSYCLDP